MNAAHGNIDELAVFVTTDPQVSGRVLRHRAESLRRMSDGMHELVAQAYRRCAAELELEAWLTDARNGEVSGPVAA